MNKSELVSLIKMLFYARIKGQIQIDFSGNGNEAKVRFTNISLEDMKKLNESGKG